MADEKALDVVETLVEVQKALDELRERYPDDSLLLVHLGFNWHVAQLLVEGGCEDMVPNWRV